MCKEVERVLHETEEVTCTVVMEGKEHTSNDFVCVMARENGDASIFYNTDALTLGMAMKMVAKSFVESMAELSEEERQSVSEILGDSFILNKEGSDEVRGAVHN